MQHARPVYLVGAKDVASTVEHAAPHRCHTKQLRNESRGQAHCGPGDARPGWSASKDIEFSFLRKEEHRRRTTVRSGPAAGRRQPGISVQYCSEPGKSGWLHEFRRGPPCDVVRVCSRFFSCFQRAPLSREARVVPLRVSDGSGAAGTRNGQRSRLAMYRAIVRGGKVTR
jgi:hypothetical protein